MHNRTDANIIKLYVCLSEQGDGGTGDASSRASVASRRGFSYESCGVSIAAGECLVNAITPLARATTVPGCVSGLGGFAGLFDVTAAGFVDPLLVASTDGVGTKLKVHHTGDIRSTHST